MSMRAAIYARVSTEEQASNYSISVQLEAARNLAQARGYRVVGEYVDEGWSGALLERPAFVRLMRDCRQGLIDVIIVYRIDRFFRDARHLLNTMKDLEGCNVKFVSATEPFDTSTPVGRYLLGQFGLIAEFERTTLLERSKAGRLKRAREGKWWGRAPLGYDYDVETGRLVLNEKEAAVVRLVFDLYSRRGETLESVAVKLNARGLKTKGGSRWADHTVHDVLTRRLYTGTSCLQIAGVEISVTAPAIISEDKFERVQSLLRERYPAQLRSKNARTFLLASLVRCGDCGCSMTPGYAARRRGGLYYYYRCTGPRRINLVRGHPERLDCKMCWVRAEKLEEAVWAVVADLITNPEHVRTVLEGELAARPEERGHHEESAARLAALAEQRRVLIRSFRDGLLPEEDLRRSLEEIAAEEMVLRRMLEDKPGMDQLSVREHVNRFEAFHRAYRDTVAGLSPQERRSIFLELLERVIVRPDGSVRIVFNKPEGAAQPLAINTTLGPRLTHPRVKKPGRKPGKEYVTVAFHRFVWEEIRRASALVGRPVSVVIRDAVEEWLASGKEIPDPAVYRKQFIRYDLKRRTTVLLKMDTIRVLKAKSKASGFPVTEIIRLAVREKLASLGLPDR